MNNNRIKFVWHDSISLNKPNLRKSPSRATDARFKPPHKLCCLLLYSVLYLLPGSTNFHSLQYMINTISQTAYSRFYFFSSTSRPIERLGSKSCYNLLFSYAADHQTPSIYGTKHPVYPSTQQHPIRPAAPDRSTMSCEKPPLPVDPGC